VPPPALPLGEAEPAGAVKEYPGQAGKRPQQQGEEQQQQQLRFLQAMCAAMQAAGYQLLSRGEWEAALCENFMVGGWLGAIYVDAMW
jgi:hypothetical protein